MVIQTLFPGNAAAPGTQLGAIDLSLPLAAGKNLSVKKYTNGWASYQSPAANQILREINESLRALGFNDIAAYSGVIADPTVRAVALLASVMSSPGYAGLQLYTTGGTTGYAATILRRFSTAEAIAKGGVEAHYYIRALASNANVVRVMKSVIANPHSAPPATPPSTTTDPSVPVTFPTGGGSGPVTFDPNAYASPPPPSTPKWPWLVAGGILAAGLVTTAVIVWR